MDETQFTTHIARALDVHLGSAFDYTCTKHTRSQGLARLDREEVFLDIVRRVSAASVLNLEVKVADIHPPLYRLRRYETQQRRMLCALEKCGVPVHYAYNATEENYAGLNGRNLLAKCNASSPASICDEKGVIDPLSHPTLLATVDRLGDMGGSFQEAAPIFSAALGKTSSELGLRRLLIAFNLQDHYIDIFDDDGIAAFRTGLNKHLGMQMREPISNLAALSDVELIGVFQGYAMKFADEFARKLPPSYDHPIPGRDL